MSNDIRNNDMGNADMTDSEIIDRAYQYMKEEQNPQFRKDIEELLAQQDGVHLRDAIVKELHFGTGGLRGIVGGGYNRMNSYIVSRATQGLAEYVIEYNKQHAEGEQRPIQAIIAYDTRHHSHIFAEGAAEVLAGNGIKAHLFNGPRPTPMLSYTLRQQKIDVGIVITASHNPPQYNGYKVYWNDGAQIVAPHDQKIIENIQKGVNIKRIAFQEGVKRALITYFGEQHDDAYIEYIRGLVLRPSLFAMPQKDAFKVIYTPLHGTGGFLLKRMCEGQNIQCAPVPEQYEPDGSFSTVQSPNPENPEALQMALAQAKREDANIVVATDPDADRVGVAIKHGKEFVILDGNQTGALLMDYILSTLQADGRLGESPAVVKTIVTTELQRDIARHYNTACIDTLTGFKHIAAKIREFEAHKNIPQFIFGGEESFGYMIGSEVRDKDGIAAAMVVIEMAYYYHQHGKTLQERLDEIYAMFGYYRERTISHLFLGASGIDKMREIMDNLRDNPPEAIRSISVHSIKDYLRQTRTDCATGLSDDMRDCPPSNVLQFILTDNTIISVRPSGTEPKIKFYISCRFTPHASLDQSKEIVHAMLDAVEQRIETWL